MTYRVYLAPSARRDLNKLPASVFSAVMEFMAGPLAENPHRVGKPLIGDQAGLRSARRGTYRIIYRILEVEIEVEVVRLRHRQDAYRPS